MKAKSFLIAILILSIPFISNAQVTPAYKPENQAPANFSGAGNTAYSMREDDTVGIQFSLAGDALFVGVSCPSWTDNFGELTFKLYKFNKDYATSVKSTPIAQYTFKDYTDNSYLGFEFTGNDVLKAGEYVIEISDANDEAGFGVGIWTTQKYPGQNLFEDGEYNKTLSARMYIEFKEKPAGTPYGELTSVKEESEDVNKDPMPFLDAVMRFSDDDAESYLNMAGSKQIGDISIEKGILKMPVQAGNDPQFTIDIQSSLEPVPCDMYPIMLIRLKRPEGAPLSGEIMFNTTESPGPVMGVSVGVTYEDTDEWQNVIVDLSSHKNYKGELLTFRYDIVHVSYDEHLFEIDHILFFGTEEAAKNFNVEDIPSATPIPTPTEQPAATPGITYAPTTATPKSTAVSSISSDMILGIAAAVCAVSAVIVVVVVLKRRK